MQDHSTWPHANHGTTLIEPGVRIAGRYRIEAPLASGGMAQVWRAFDEVLTRPVAVKVLLPHLAADPSFVARFRREAVAAARLAHPSIVSIFDTCDAPEAIVMELIEGRTLRDELDRRGFLSTNEALEIAAGVAEALDAAHRAGIVHRDVKPGNILLGADGQLKVTDFGIAKAAVADDPELPDLTEHGQLVGTAKYVAPEQVEGDPVDARSDIYSLGVLLYEMLCGRPPFAAQNDQATAAARLKGPPPRPRSVLRTIPSRVDTLVMKTLSRRPEDRFQTASALRAELLNLVDSDEFAVVEAHESPVTEDEVSFARAERSWLVPSVLVVLVALSLGLAWMLIGGSEARRDLLDLVDRVRPGGEGTGSASPLPARATAFDPFGDQTEHDELAALVLDGDPATVWSSERYRSRDLGGLKPGVGLVLALDRPAMLRELQVVSPTDDWALAIYVTDETGDDFAQWGDPVVTEDGVPSGRQEFDLDNRTGRRVLVWFTDLGDGVGVQLDIGELTIRGR